MIHDPCGELNPSYPCMKEGKYSKKYPRQLIAEIQTGYDSYPKYRQRSPEYGDGVTTIKVKNMDVEVGNIWVVPCTPLLSEMFQAHINVEFCNSVKAIKYICKYVNKGSDMAIFEVPTETTKSLNFK